MEYTKGNWRVGKSFGKAGDEIPIYGIDHHELARVFIHNGEQFANAHLITSAPAMYEALKEMVSFVKHYGEQRHLKDFPEVCAHCVLIRRAEEALAKAENK